MKTIYLQAVFICNTYNVHFIHSFNLIREINMIKFIENAKLFLML